MPQLNTKGKFSKENIRPETAGLIDEKLIDVNQKRLKKRLKKIGRADFIHAAIKNTKLESIIELELK